MSEDSAALEELIARMVAFVLGEDRSMAFAQDMEALLVTRLRHDPRLVDLGTGLAMYRPGGGEHLLDGEGLSFQCRETLHDLGHHRFCQHA